MLFKIRDIDEFLEGFKAKEYTLEDASLSIFRDKENILKLLPFDDFGEIYNYMPGKLQKDAGFVKDLVGLNGNIFMKAKRYHGDNEFAMSAIKTCPQAAKYLRFDNVNGVELARQAVGLNAFAYRHLTDYKNDRGVILTALSSEGILYRYLSRDNKLNEEYAEVSLSSTPFVYRFLPKALKPSTKLASVAIEADKGYAYSIYKELLNEEVKADPKVSVLACSKNLESIMDVPTETFVSQEFQKLFNEMTEKTKNEYKEKGDEKGMQEYTEKLDELKSSRELEILQAQLNNQFGKSEMYPEGAYEANVDFNPTANFVAPVDNEPVMEQ